MNTNPLHQIAKQHLDTNQQGDTHTTPETEDPTWDGNPTTWRTWANCHNKTHLMFPKDYKDITYIPQARALCRTCPVKEPCLDYALEFPAADMHGVWAGLTPRQLAAEQRRRGVKAVRPTLAQMWGP